ncbi:MAG: hypothetical protein P1P89_19755 [Desulfobacterales bacterium]|nr:hypothetical protein [Desulfobacterales bacterium]
MINVSDVLTEWSKPVKIKSVGVDTVDFVPVETVTARLQDCVVQVAEKEDIKKDNIDWSKEYLMVHSKESIVMGEIIEFENEDYKVVSRGPWRGYGYMEVIAEQTKEPLRVAT